MINSSTNYTPGQGISYQYNSDISHEGKAQSIIALGDGGFATMNIKYDYPIFVAITPHYMNTDLFPSVITLYNVPANVEQIIWSHDIYVDGKTLLNFGGAPAWKTAFLPSPAASNFRFAVFVDNIEVGSYQSGLDAGSRVSITVDNTNKIQIKLLATWNTAGNKTINASRTVYQMAWLGNYKLTWGEYHQIHRGLPAGLDFWPIAKFPIIRPLYPSLLYYQGDIVEQLGSIYRVTQTHYPHPATGYLIYKDDVAPLDGLSLIDGALSIPDVNNNSVIASWTGLDAGKYILLWDSGIYFYSGDLYDTSEPNLARYPQMGYINLNLNGLPDSYPNTTTEVIAPMQFGTLYIIFFIGQYTGNAKIDVIYEGNIIYTTGFKPWNMQETGKLLSYRGSNGIFQIKITYDFPDTFHKMGISKVYYLADKFHIISGSISGSSPTGVFIEHQRPNSDIFSQSNVFLGRPNYAYSRPYLIPDVEVEKGPANINQTDLRYLIETNNNNHEVHAKLFATGWGGFNITDLAPPISSIPISEMDYYNNKPMPKFRFFRVLPKFHKGFLAILLNAGASDVDSALGSGEVVWRSFNSSGIYDWKIRKRIEKTGGGFLTIASGYSEDVTIPKSGGVLARFNTGILTSFNFSGTLHIEQQNPLPEGKENFPTWSKPFNLSLDAYLEKSSLGTINGKDSTRVKVWFKIEELFGYGWECGLVGQHSIAVEYVISNNASLLMSGHTGIATLKFAPYYTNNSHDLIFDIETPPVGQLVTLNIVVKKGPGRPTVANISKTIQF
jgi:hypothetical protein